MILKQVRSRSKKTIPLIPVDRRDAVVRIPPGQTVTLGPGHYQGYHYEDLKKRGILVELRSFEPPVKVAKVAEEPPPRVADPEPPTPDSTPEMAVDAPSSGRGRRGRRHVEVHAADGDATSSADQEG